MNKVLVMFLLFVCLIGALDAAKRPSKEQKVGNVLKMMELSGDEEASSAVYMPGEKIPTNMPQEHKYFRDFCINAQDDIKAYVRRKINRATANVYTIMLTSASDIGSEVLKAHAKAVEEGNQVILEATIVEDARNSKDIDENVDKTLVNIANDPKLFQRVGTAVKMVIGVVIDTARSLVFQRIAELKERLGTSQLRANIEEACSSISAELLPKINQRLDSTKESLQQELSGYLLSKVQAANANNVGCTLSGRVWKVDKFCEILKLAGPSVYALVGIN